MISEKISDSEIKELYELIVSLKSVEDCGKLFEDLCTKREIQQMAQRVKAAKLLIDGMTYNQVIEKTDISSATLSRVSRCVQYGSGYTEFISK